MSTSTMPDPSAQPLAKRRLLTLLKIIHALVWFPLGPLLRKRRRRSRAVPDAQTAAEERR